MGKKDKSKKGKGAEKSSVKVQKKLEKRLMKAEKCQEEQSIEEMLQEFQREQQKLSEITLSVTGPPTPRSHFSFVASPDTGELMIFGGEYFDGKKITMFSDVFLYNCKEETWTLVKSPTCPPPRSGHQAVYVKSSSVPASVWIFGGEYASPTQIRFYHYKDLWCFRMRTRKWELIQCEGSSMPSARSGHRMLFWKQSILLFGGFNDTGRKAIYFNDLWQFDLVSRRWILLKISGDIPSPRSACLLFGSSDLKNIYLIGGYRKEQVTKDLERGVTCSDYFRLTLEKDGSIVTSISVRPSGLRPKPPCNAMVGVVHAPNRALVFGGVHDVESEDGETVVGYFHNDLYSIELDKAKWHLFTYAIAKQTDHNEKKAAGELSMEEPVMTTKICEGAFTVTLNEGTTKPPGVIGATKSSSTVQNCMVPPRSSAGMALLGSILYLYGGVFEVGDRKITLDDFYCLDLSQPISWKCLFSGTQDNQEWFGSDLEDDDDEEEEDNEADSGGDEDLVNAHETRQLSSTHNRMDVDDRAEDASDNSDDSDDDDDDDEGKFEPLLFYILSELGFSLSG
ncbi:Kelch domain-containing protein 4 [Fasciolopsis buskii]|uniref:Kelch domain-containing protein 4 n=1 Tax=Fasciolopsis buskii TaxID=27845 RepID=A0A8E0RQW6_9TREM|nr:Kelch domain-containing protein 4 [Fasciolopsis buski]